MGAHKERSKTAGKAEGQRGSLPAELSRVNLNAAGVDVGAGSHFVAVPEGRCEQPVREFGAFTADMYRMADWLEGECGVETVAMESTGVYWIPLFGVLEERGFEVLLVDPRRIKNVPGRKTDVLDCPTRREARGDDRPGLPGGLLLSPRPVLTSSLYPERQQTQPRTELDGPTA